MSSPTPRVCQHGEARVGRPTFGHIWSHGPCVSVRVLPPLSRYVTRRSPPPPPRRPDTPPPPASARALHVIRVVERFVFVFVLSREVGVRVFETFSRPKQHMVQTGSHTDSLVHCTLHCQVERETLLRGYLFKVGGKERYVKGLAGGVVLPTCLATSLTHIWSRALVRPATTSAANVDAVCRPEGVRRGSGGVPPVSRANVTPSSHCRSFVTLSLCRCAHGCGAATVSPLRAPLRATCAEI
eukprot:1108696-Pyramimonas_sp.AAC.1